MPDHRSLEYQPVAVSAAEIDELDLADGAAEEAGAEALEFFHRVGGEAGDLWLALQVLQMRAASALAVDEMDGGVGGGFGGVDDAHAGGDGALDERAQKRVMGAAQD